MVDACRDENPATNPGVSLGLAIGTLAKAGRDKLTFIADPAIASFGAWLEQLIAESTGKHGIGHRPGRPRAARRDRGLRRRPRLRPPDARRRRTARAATTAGDTFVDAAAAAGHPVIRIDLADPIDLGARDVPLGGRDRDRGRGPRDRPVRPAERRGGEGADPQGPRRRLVDGERPAAPPPPIVADAATPASTLHGDAPLRLTAGDGTLVGELARHLARRKPNAYLALQAFIAPSRRGHGGDRPDPRASSATRRAARRPPATGRASSTRPASSTRAARRPAGSSS